ncbi:MAG: MarR family winged helix-turn-helix transcriptional regulator [Jatrophihabitans sp.]
MNAAAQPDAQELTEAVTQVRRALRRSVRPGFARAMGQVEMLQTVADLGPVRVGELADTLRLAPSTASELLSRLVREELLGRATDKDDRRAATVRLTAGGRRELDRWRRAHEQRLAEALDRLSATQRRTLGNAVPALRALAIALGEG